MEKFFEAGKTYVRDMPFKAPELLPEFKCDAVIEHPDNGKDGAEFVRIAVGWGRPGHFEDWHLSALGMDVLKDWVPSIYGSEMALEEQT